MSGADPGQSADRCKIERDVIVQRPTIAVISLWNAFPAENGGQRRALDLYRALARSFEVVVCTLGPVGYSGRFTGDDGITEIRTARSPEFAELEHEAMREMQSPISLAYVQFDRFIHAVPEFERTVARTLATARATILGASTLYPLGRRNARGPIVYQADNVEAALAPSFFEGAHALEHLVAVVSASERACVSGSDLILTMSPEDREVFAERYGAGLDRCFAFPPSIDSGDFRQIEPGAKAMGARPHAVFIGSDWPPNRDAVRLILEIALAVPEVDFTIIGSVGAGFHEVAASANVRFTGFVRDERLAAYLASADIGLNPCRQTSGMNIKMLDYVRAAIPIVTTPIGARGFAFESDVHALVREVNEFPAAIRSLTSDATRRDAIARRAVAHVRALLDRDRNAVALRSRMQALCGDRGVGWEHWGIDSR